MLLSAPEPCSKLAAILFPHSIFRESTPAEAIEGARCMMVYLDSNDTHELLIKYGRREVINFSDQL